MCWGSDRRFIWENSGEQRPFLARTRIATFVLPDLCVTWLFQDKEEPTDWPLDRRRIIRRHDAERNILRRRRIQAQLKVSTTVTDAPWERSVRYKRNVKRQRSNRHIKSTAAPIKDLMSRSWYTCYAAWNFNKIKPLLVMRKETQSLG